PFNGGNYPGCSSVGSGNEFVYDPNPNSFDYPPDFSYQSPQPQYETYTRELCGNDAHYGYDCLPQVLDDESFSNEDVLKEIYSNPLFNEEIISIKIDPHHFNAESDLIESLLNQNSLIISFPKIDSLLEEFSDELAHIDLISPEINEAGLDLEEEIRLVEKSLSDNSSP
nr:hypothetical protein [Tanacetum cinerariifolium]